MPPFQGTAGLAGFQGPPPPVESIGPRAAILAVQQFQALRLFDDLVGDDGQRRRHLDAERLAVLRLITSS
jgi:hypothetical protein